MKLKKNININPLPGIIITAFLIFIFQGIKGQEVLLEKRVNDSMANNNTGPNKKRFSHIYIGTSAIINYPESEIKFIPGISSSFHFGYRFKYKLNKWDDTGFELRYKQRNYYLIQSNNKFFPDNTNNDRERLKLNMLGVVIYNRMNFGKRGNHIGIFVDLGFYGHWMYRAKHIIVNKSFSEEEPYQKQRIVNTRLDYLEKIGYGGVFRMGYNRFVIFIESQFSQVVMKEKFRMDLPKTIVGIQLGLHKQ